MRIELPQCGISMMLARIPRNESLKGMYLIILHGATIEYRATDVQ